MILAGGLGGALLGGPRGLAGCVAWGLIPEGSQCRAFSEDLKWLHPPAALERASVASHRYERTVFDPAFVSGVFVSGNLEFELRPQGRFLVEVFLAVPAALRESYVLEGPSGIVDSRYRAYPGPDRLRPKRGWRHISLVGMVEAPGTVRVRSDAAKYVLVAFRWTPEQEFEQKWVPRWLERARLWAQTPFAPDGEAARVLRRDYLEQLGARLSCSAQKSVRQEGLLQQTRAAYWAAAEDHEPRDIARTDELFRAALRMIPHEPILRQMVSASCLGMNAPAERMPHGPYCENVAAQVWPLELSPAPPGAPSWAVAQRELFARADAITRWWVEHRRRPNGELGGGWGDDVEILRQWAPLALGFGSQVALEGIRRVADGLWASGVLQDGYNRQISDVEHASEPSTDTVPLRVAILPGDVAGLERLKVSASCADHWIAQQPDGRFRFRGAWFNCREFDPAPERAVDVHMNVRAMGPALWYAALTREARMIRLLERWAEAWLEAMRSTAYGKPRGIFPSAVRSADGSYLIGSDRWDKPQVEWDYYQWSGEAQEALTSLLLALHDLTGERRWLEAAGESFQVMAQCGAYPRLCDEVRSRPEAFYEWRRRSGDDRYDRAFGYVAARDPSELLAQIAREEQQAAARLAVNFAMYTSEVIYTDRVYYRWPALVRWHLFGGEAPRGDRYPTFFVTWPPEPASFARLVLEAHPERLTLLLYNFEPRELAVPIRVWRLKPGLYRWADGEARIEHLPSVIKLRLPPQREFRVEIRRVGE